MEFAQIDTNQDKKHTSNNVLSIDNRLYDTVIIGAGAAGIGVGISLVHAGVESMLIVERDTVGSSFAAWPDETRFITPSFPSNSIGMLDLNSIAIGVSPAYNMRVEHPTGQDFADHLVFLADQFELPIWDQTNVTGIEKIDDVFTIKTNNGSIQAKNVIWAAGEYQYPSTDLFEGSDLCRHTSTVSAYSQLEGEEHLIIGGYESGIDAAYHLSNNGKKVQVFDSSCPWGEETSDPSVALSTYSFERITASNFGERVELHGETKVIKVEHSDGVYSLLTSDGQTFTSTSPPLLASGFDGSHKFVSHLFEQREDGFPLLNENDCSTTTDGMYLCGPSVRHDGHIFCFIFKYRQRFGIVARSIADSLGIETEDFVEVYRSWGMFLDDLSCCGQECLTC
jgi:thioredoxin reductase